MFLSFIQAKITKFMVLIFILYLFASFIGAVARLGQILIWSCFQLSWSKGQGKPLKCVRATSPKFLRF